MDKVIHLSETEIDLLMRALDCRIEHIENVLLQRGFGSLMKYRIEDYQRIFIKLDKIKQQ